VNGKMRDRHHPSPLDAGEDSVLANRREGARRAGVDRGQGDPQAPLYVKQKAV
jgi:hypothetical protein